MFGKMEKEICLHLTTKKSKMGEDEFVDLILFLISKQVFSVRNVNIWRRYGWRNLTVNGFTLPILFFSLKSFWFKIFWVLVYSVLFLMFLIVSQRSTKTHRTYEKTVIIIDKFNQITQHKAKLTASLNQISISNGSSSEWDEEQVHLVTNQHPHLETNKRNKLILL